MSSIKRAAATALAAGFLLFPALSLPFRAGDSSFISPEDNFTSVTPEISPEPSTPEITPDTEIPPADVENDIAPEGDLPKPPAETPPETEQPVISPAAQKQTYITCTGNQVNLRLGAGTKYGVATTIEKGVSYAVTEKIGDWYGVYHRGKKLYLSARYAEEFTLEKSENAAAESVLEEGYKLLGTPYVYGAVRLHDGKGNFSKKFSKKAFDCSSLTQYVFYQGAKKLIGTTTREQVLQGVYVAKKDLRRGDCIYFTNAARFYHSGTERIGHVAIYLGEGYILHTSSDYARIEKLTSARLKYYIESRRFI